MTLYSFMCESGDSSHQPISDRVSSTAQTMDVNGNDTGTDSEDCSRPHDNQENHGNWSKLSREERRKRRRSTQKYRTAHANRERVRVKTFNDAYTELRQLLPTLPPDRKLSKIEILRLAICYISHLDHILRYDP